MMNLKDVEGRSHGLRHYPSILSEGAKENLNCSIEIDSVPTKIQTPELRVLTVHAEDDSHHTVDTSSVFKHHLNCVMWYTVQHTCDV
jgi:hypothetical protein